MNKHLSIDVAPTPQSLALLQQRIALESQYLANFSRTVQEVVPSVVDAVKNFFSSNPVPQTTKFLDDRNKPAFARLINSHNYINTSKLSMYVPEGFTGSLVAYAEQLLASAVHASSVVSDVLNPYNQFLSGLINSDQTRLSTRDPLAFLDKVKVSREALTQDLAKHFAAGSTITRTEVGKVIQRNKDWETVLLLLPKIKEQVTKVSPTAVNNAMGDTLALLDALKLAVQSGDLANISAQTLRSLSAHTLLVAREVEFYSVTYFRVQVLDKAVQDSVDQLTKALAD